MKPLLTLFALALSLFMGAALAASGDVISERALQLDQCNKEAGELKLTKDEHKAFMPECMTTEKLTQYDRMKACYQGAIEKKLKGKPRRAFIKECLGK